MLTAISRAMSLLGTLVTALIVATVTILCIAVVMMKTGLTTGIGFWAGIVVTALIIIVESTVLTIVLTEQKYERIGISLAASFGTALCEGLAVGMYGWYLPYQSLWFMAIYAVAVVVSTVGLTAGIQYHKTA